LKRVWSTRGSRLVLVGDMVVAHMEDLDIDG